MRGVANAFACNNRAILQLIYLHHVVLKLRLEPLHFFTRSTLAHCSDTVIEELKRWHCINALHWQMRNVVHEPAKVELCETLDVVKLIILVVSIVLVHFDFHVKLGAN